MSAVPDDDRQPLPDPAPWELLARDLAALGPGPHYRGCWAVDIILGKS